MTLRLVVVDHVESPIQHRSRSDVWRPSDFASPGHKTPAMLKRHTHLRAANVRQNSRRQAQLTCDWSVEAPELAEPPRSFLAVFQDSTLSATRDAPEPLGSHLSQPTAKALGTRIARAAFKQPLPGRR